MVTHREALTPVGAVVQGLLASAVGTLAMDMALFARYRRDGGTSGFWNWESSESVRHWDEAPAPAQVGKRLVEGLFQLELPDERARLVNNLTHWAYGLLAGAQYGLVVGSLPASRIWYGVPFGATVWGGGYVVLPAAGLYRPIWEYDWRTLAKDLGAHLVYGVSTAAVFSRLAGSSRPGSVAARAGGYGLRRTGSRLRVSAIPQGLVANGPRALRSRPRREKMASTRISTRWLGR